MIVEYNKLEKTPYKSVIDNENAMYCEVRYTRDKSSFAGIAFEITDGCGITCSDIKENRCLFQSNGFQDSYGMVK